jgi:hypothetical protein
VDRTAEPVAEPGESLLNGAIGYSGSASVIHEYELAA